MTDVLRREADALTATAEELLEQLEGVPPGELAAKAATVAGLTRAAAALFAILEDHARAMLRAQALHGRILTLLTAVQAARPEKYAVRNVGDGPTGLLHGAPAPRDGPSEG